MGIYAIKFYIEYANLLYDDKPLLFPKYVIPMLAKLIDDTKPDIKLAVARLVKTLNEICPEELRTGIPISKIQVILK